MRTKRGSLIADLVVGACEAAQVVPNSDLFTQLVQHGCVDVLCACM